MTMTLDAIETEIMNLNTEDRSRLLDRLISSLDSDAAIDAAILAEWESEAGRRDAEVDAGQVQLVPLDDALAALYAKLQ
jgi:hypothetical protein